MLVYLVRHGQSQLNVENKDQGPEGALSEEGRKQAKVLAERFQKIPVDLVVSSTYERAKETAEIINEHLGKSLTFSELIAERRPPSKFIGVTHDDPEYIAAHRLMAEKRLVDPSWRYSDEENFLELRDRANKALDFFLTLKAEKVLAVTHAGFLRLLFAVIVMGPEIKYEEYLRFFRVLKTANTGITVIKHEELTLPYQGTLWRLVSWNDHAHLG